MNILGVFLFSFLSFGLRGFTIQTLFNWFIATAFNIHPITFVVGLALSVIAEYLHPMDFTKTETHENSVKITMAILRSIIILIIGFIIHLFY